MTKQDLQQELKEKVKEGVKPSDIRKLKKSKSTGDIPKAPSLPPQSTPLTRSQSNQPFTDPQYPYTTLISQQQTIEKLEKETLAKSDTITLLRKKIKSLETQSKEPTHQSTELDQSLLARHKNLKDWFSSYQKNKKLDQELKENIDEASQELIEQDKTITQLRQQVKHLELTNQSLQKDLNLAQKLAEFRKSPLPSLPTPETSFWKGALIGCFLGLSFYFLNRTWKSHFNDH